MLSRRRAHTGASTLAVCLLGALLLGGFFTAAELVVVVGTDARAQAGADSAAHAAASLLAGDPDRDAVAGPAAAGRCLWSEDRPDGPFAEECRPALAAARATMASVPGLRLVQFDVTTDARTHHSQALGGRVGLATYALVALDRRLPLTGRICMDGPAQTSVLCFAVAHAGAEEVDPQTPGA